MARASNIQSAKRLLRAAKPSAGTDLPSGHAARAGHLLVTLFQALGPVIGAAGVRATFGRSVRLNKLAYPCLEAIPTGSEQRHNAAELAALLAQCLGNLESAVAAKLAVDLYATFFDLVSTFIGDDLLWRIVKRPPSVMDETGIEETD